MAVDGRGVGEVSPREKLATSSRRCPRISRDLGGIGCVVAVTV
jgi:hypothetical protein